MLKHLCYLLLVLATTMTLPAQAADPVYEVEIIAFSRTVDPALSGGEDASLLVHRPDLDSGFSLDMLGGLPIDNLQLGNVVARLKADPNYQVLLHQAWRQPVGTSATAPWLHLSAGSVSDTSGSQPEFDGLVKLYRNPYLFMDADLLLRRLGMNKAPPKTSATQYAGSSESTEPSAKPAVEAQSPTLKEYPLVSSNRVMEGQITYFDGPMLGLLVQARPVK
jgi:hypothetical protein